MSYKESKIVQRDAILRIAQNYGDALIKHVERNVEKDWWVKASDVQQHLRSNNSENIASGNSGVLLFVVELYQFTKNKEYLDFAIKCTDILVKRVQFRPTDNYAFYTGRSGLVFLLIQMYTLTQDKKYLENASDILKNISYKFLRSSYTSDYFYNGRSGVLLIAYQLYHHTNEPFLLELCSELLEKIIENAVLTDEGLSWKGKEEINIKNPCSFAFGTYGIKYVLDEIHQSTSCGSLRYIISQIEKYQENCWMDNYNNWGDFRSDINSSDEFLSLKGKYERKESLSIPGDDLTWAFGFFGIYKGASLSKDLSDTKINELLNNLDKYPLHLYSGVAGMGLCLQGTSQQNHIYDYLSNQLMETDVSFDGGLFHGNIGACYALRKVTDTDEEGVQNVLFPKIVSTKKEIKELNLAIENTLSTVISKKYPRTMALLEWYIPKVLDAFYENIGRDRDALLEAFEVFLNTELLKRINGSYSERIADLLDYEKKLYEYSKLEMPMVDHYFEAYIHYLKTIKLLKNSDEWLLDQTLKISDEARIIRTKWNWSKENNKIRDNVSLDPDNFETYIKIERDGRITEIELTKLKIIIEPFNDSSSVKDALSYIKSNPNSLMEKYRPVDRIGFLNRVDFLFLEKIRNLIYHKVLVFGS